jgi:hypothetical protein
MAAAPGFFGLVQLVSNGSQVYCTWEYEPAGVVPEYFFVHGGANAYGQLIVYPSGILDPYLSGTDRQAPPVNGGSFSASASYFYISATYFNNSYDSKNSSIVQTNAYASQVTNLSFLSNTTSSITVRWDPPAILSSPVSGYQVFYRIAGTSSWTSGGTPTGAPHEITGLSIGTSYDVMVKAVTAAGVSQFADKYQAIIPASTQSVTVPTEPTAVSASTPVPSDGTISLSWSAPSFNGGSAVTDYVIQQSTNGGASWSTVTDAVTAATTATLSGFANGTSYTFRVAAVNVAGTGPFSLASNTVTPATYPSAPTIVTGVSGDKRVTVTWTAPASNGGSAITDYTVQYQELGGSWTTFTDGTSTTTSTVVTGLTGETPYLFRVAAVNAVGLGSWSNEFGPVVPTDVPGQPTGLVASIESTDETNGLIKLDWNEPATTGGLPIEGYRIQTSENGGSTWVRTRSSIDWTPYLYVSEDLDKTYVYRVAAINANGTGPYSAISNAVSPVLPPPPGALPSAVVDVLANPGDKKLTVTWSAPSSSGGPGSSIIEYKIRYSTDEGATWITITEPA